MRLGSFKSGRRERSGAYSLDKIFVGRQNDREAQMAELVDALVSGTSGGYLLEVRVFFWAPLLSLIAFCFVMLCGAGFFISKTPVVKYSKLFDG